MSGQSGGPNQQSSRQLKGLHAKAWEGEDHAYGDTRQRTFRGKSTVETLVLIHVTVGTTPSSSISDSLYPLGVP